MLKRVYFPCFLMLIALLAGGCEKTDVTPAFITISKDDLANSIDLSNIINDLVDPIYDSEVLKSQDFKHVWVYAGAEKLGVWELPCKVPVLNAGSVNIQLIPATEMNGTSTTLPAYSFVGYYKQTVNLEKGKVFDFSSTPITFQYLKGSVDFPLIESFEQSTSFKPKKEGVGAAIEISTVNGKNVGMLSLVEETEFDILSKEIDLPGTDDQSFVFFELDYKADYNESSFEGSNPKISIGLKFKNSSGVEDNAPLVVFNATKDWKKGYVNLTQVIQRNSLSYLKGAQISISGFRDDDQEEVKIYLDNVKVIYQTGAY